MTALTTPEADRRLYSSRMASLLLYGTFGLLMFGPVAFGSVEPWSIFTLEAGSTLLVLLWLAKQWIDGDLKIKWNPLFLPMAAFALRMRTGSFWKDDTRKLTHALEKLPRRWPATANASTRFSAKRRSTR